MDDEKRNYSDEELVFALKRKNQALENVIDDYREIIDVLRKEVYKQKNKLDMKRILRFFGLVTYKEYKQTTEVLVQAAAAGLGLYLDLLACCEDDEREKEVKKESKESKGTKKDSSK